MSRIIYKPQGVCSQEISFDIENNIIHNVKFVSGCSGNLEGISRLIEGLKVDEVVKKLKGIHCGYKNTSCPDQLSQALESSLSSH